MIFSEYYRQKDLITQNEVNDFIYEKLVNGKFSESLVLKFSHFKIFLSHWPNQFTNT